MLCILTPQCFTFLDAIKIKCGKCLKKTEKIKSSILFNFLMSVCLSVTCRFGRRPTVLVSAFLSSGLALATALVPDIASFSVLRFTLAVSEITLVLSAFVLGVKYWSPRNLPQHLCNPLLLNGRLPRAAAAVSSAW